MFLVITYSIMKRKSEHKSVAAFVCLSLFFWILHYLPFLLAIVLSPFSFVYCIISLFFWLLYYLSLFFWLLYYMSLFFWLMYYLPFLLAIVLSPFSFGYCIICPFSINGFWLGTVVMVIVWWSDLQLHKQSIPITTYVVISTPAQARCTLYNIMWWSMSVTCMRQIGGFQLRVLRFSPPIKLTATI